jgi:hypothetical protein
VNGADNKTNANTAQVAVLAAKIRAYTRFSGPAANIRTPMRIKHAHFAHACGLYDQ